MDMILSLFEALRTMPFPQAVGWAVAGNIVAFALTLAAGEGLVRAYQQHAITEPPPPLTWAEAGFAASCVVLNTAITILGIYLWRVGIIEVRYTLGPLVVADVAFLFAAMDFAMYCFHRVAHHPWLYPIIHDTHHRYENPRPLTLFVLNPFETVGFGLLWLVVMVSYPASWLGIAIYLTGNLTFGLMGHLGVEPFPRAWLQTPILRYISTSTFHAEHHQDRFHNFGFYTLIWDRLFGTLSPDYRDDFQRATVASRSA